MIRVAHFNQFNCVGGIEQMLIHLCRHADRSRFENRLATTGESPMSAELQSLGVHVYTTPGGYAEAARWADLINLHMGEYAYSAPMLPLVQSFGVPYVVTLHDRFVLPPIATPAICTSHHVHAMQTEMRRFVTIPNGVDLARFQPRPRARRPEVVLTRVCRPPKCAPYFWEAVHLVLARYPQARVRIVGNPDPGTHPDPRVEFLGIRRDIPEILADTDLFVYTPYPHLGSHDVAVLEASAAGVPCVVSDTPPVRETVEEGRTGYRVPFGDVHALVARVGELIENTALRRQMGEAAAALARERFDVRITARRYEAVYEAVLHARSSAHGRRGLEVPA